MHRRVEIAITGSGSLATEVLHALGRTAREPLTVAIIGRDIDRLATLGRSASDPVGNPGGYLQVLPIAIDWSDDSLISRTISSLRPKVLVHTASLQSPWSLNRGDQWSHLVKSVGFGFTLPLQAVLALKIARALALTSPGTNLINGCYPDSVNRIVTAHGLNVIGGLGNVAILASLLSSWLPLQESNQLRVIAHHSHVAAVIEGKATPAGLQVWIDESPVHATAKHLLSNAHLPANLNNIVGAAAAPMLFALLGRSETWRGHCPGPLGLPGGYPVMVSDGRVELDLPSGVTLAQAKETNTTAALADGIVLEDNGWIELTEVSFEALKRVVNDKPQNLGRFHARQVEEQAELLLALRHSLH